MWRNNVEVARVLLQLAIINSGGIIFSVRPVTLAQQWAFFREEVIQVFLQCGDVDRAFTCF
jgi:hypothetical protein